MLVLLNFVLVLILLSSLKLPIPGVRCDVPDTEATDSELDNLKEVFYRNLLADLRAEANADGESVVITEELKNRVDQRIRGFVKVTKGEVGGVRARRHASGHGEVEEAGQRRSSKSNGLNEEIEADTADAERLYLKGFRERGHVPVNFPIDLCLLKVGRSIFAASLHVRKSKDNYANQTIVSFYVRQKGQFLKYMEYPAVQARSFDCISYASLGFVAVVNYYEHAKNQDAPEAHLGLDDGSPVFQISENGNTEIVQKFRQSHQNTVHMWTIGNDVYLTHTYRNLNESEHNVCPLYRWSGYYFDVIDNLPCYNAISIDAFSIEQTLYLVVVNQMNDEAVDEDTFSDIFRFNYEDQKFEFHQKIYIYSVSDIAYFFLDHGDYRDHYLITGNSRAGTEKVGNLDYDKASIVYKFVEGYFVPFQKIELHMVKQFLPVMRENGEFLLLIHCQQKPLLIYEFDGYKFVPSRIDYTRDAFSNGVSSMRVYRHIMNASLIVIANKQLFGTAPNIFSPIYGVENNLKDVYGQFLSWCGDTTQLLESVNLEEVYNKLITLPKVEDEVAKLDKSVELKGSSVKELKASVLHTKEYTYNQEAYDYLNSVHDRLQELKARVERIRALIDSSLKLNEAMEVRGDVKVPQVIASGGLVKELETRNLNNEEVVSNVGSDADQTEQEDVINVDRLIVENRMAVKFLNGYASETLLHTTDNFQTLKDVDLHVKEMNVRGHLYVEKQIDGIHFTPDSILIRGADQTFYGRTLRVNNLTVVNLKTKNLNTSDVGTIFSHLDKAAAFTAAQARAEQSYPKTLKEIRVQDLELTGLINDVDINYIDQNALKVEGDQVITGQFNFDKIVVPKVIAPHKRLSGIDLNSMVLTVPTEDQPNFTVRQDVQFINPVYFEKLHLNDRLNHIPVVDGQLQVLLKDSKEPQQITGTKSFDNVQLLGPIFLQGKVNSSSLSKLNPVSTITEDIYLEGDFEISGDTTIAALLNSSNIYGASQTYNFADLYRHGLPLNAASSNQNFVFKEPLIVERAFAKSINDLDPSDFIPTTSKKLQHITGRKIFTGDLTIRGDRVDAAVINGVDLKHLNQTVLKRTGDQVIEGTIHFKELIASNVATKKTIFEERPLGTLLHVNSNQKIKAKVRLENCKLTIQGDVSVGKLETEGKSTVYGYDLDYLFADTLWKGQMENNSVPITGAKSFLNVTVGELVLLDQAMINDVDLVGLKKISDPLEKDVIVEDTLILKNPMRVRNVFFNGTINGVTQEEFGRSWLMNEYNQTFTAPQVFENVVADNVFVEEYFNGVKLEELAQDVYYLNQNEHLDQAIFHEGIVSHQPVTVKGLVSGLNLATDVLLHRSSTPQRLKDVRIDGNLIVRNRIHVGSTLNDMNYAKMREVAISSGLEQPINIEVHGNVHFHLQPEIVHLNGYNLEQLHREVWLSNRPEVLTGSYRFENVNFASYVYIKGLINGLDLDEIEHNYMSISKPQNVSTPLIFTGPTELRKDATFGQVTLEGLLKGSKESKGLDIVDFDKHVLKKGVDQVITGKWVFHDVEAYGNLNLTTINGLDIRRDILLNNMEQAVFTGAKRIDNLRVHNLRCPDPCIIQGVDFNEWIAKSVRKDRNYTIEGVTYVESATILGDIEALGPVNNVTFDQQHLLLKSVPQVLEGDLYVKTKFPERNLIYPSAVEWLETEAINGKNFNEFIANLARVENGTVVIETPVTLTQTLRAQHVDTGDRKMFGVNINQLLQEVEYGDQLSKYETKLRRLHMVGQSLVDTFNSRTPYLSRYQPIKPLIGRFRTVVTLTLPLSPSPVELLVTHLDDGKQNSVEFYRWNKKDSQYRIAKGFPAITSSTMAVNRVKRVIMAGVQNLFVEFYDHEHQIYRQSVLDLEPPDFMIPKKTQKLIPIYEFNSTLPQDVVSIKILDLDCIGMFSTLTDGMEIYCLRLENLVYYLKFHQSLSTPAVRQALHLDGRLILLSRDNLLQVWKPQADYKLALFQLVKVHHPTFITVTKFEHQLFIAINSQYRMTPGGTAHHGSIEIWRDTRPQHANSTFTKYQTILTKVPRQIQFSVIPLTTDLMLYTLTDNQFHPLVIYRYEGVSGFREYLTSNTLRTDSKRLSVIKLDRKQRELLALIADTEISFIEAIIEGK